MSIRLFSCLLFLFLVSAANTVTSAVVDDVEPDLSRVGYWESGIKNNAISSSEIVFKAGFKSVFITKPIFSESEFNAVGIVFDTDPPAPHALSFEIQIGSSTSDRKSSWLPGCAQDDLTPEQQLQSGELNPDYGTVISNLFFRDQGDGNYVRLKVFPAVGTDFTVKFQNLRIIFINSTKGPTEEEILKNLASIYPYEKQETDYPKPPIATRDQWGAHPPTASMDYCTVTHNCIHHTAAASDWSATTFSECAARVRAHQEYHMYTLQWKDIGYNFLVCKHGTIWEGRYGGDDVVGAHDGYNWGSMGVSLMGYFHTPYNQVPTSEMIDALTELFAWKCYQRSIDPLGYSYYRGYYGNMRNIYGHRDVGSTACPGDIVYAMLPDIRNEVNDKLYGGGGSVVILDNDKARVKGDWVTGTMAPDKYGSDYLWISTSATGNEAAGWIIHSPLTGVAKVEAWWSQGTNRCPQAQYIVFHEGGSSSVYFDQQVNGGKWNSLGQYYFKAGKYYKIGITNKATAGYVVICDAIRLTKI